VHQKTAAILTLTDVRPEDKNALSTLSSTIKVVSLLSNDVDFFKSNYNDKLISEHSRHWGGGKLGQKSMDTQAKKAKAASLAIKI
jgi:large subunit ribosomal protein L7Ae